MVTITSSAIAEAGPICSAFVTFCSARPAATGRIVSKNADAPWRSLSICRNLLAAVEREIVDHVDDQQRASTGHQACRVTHDAQSCLQKFTRPSFLVR